MDAMKIQIAFTASRRPEAQEALQRLTKRYGHCAEEDAEVVVALGGDGAMLEAMRRRFDDRKPVYGMNRGTVGFLMNDFEEGDLVERINKAAKATLMPLRMIATDVSGERYERLAINEVSLFRETAQSAKLRIRVDGQERMSELTCDGIMVATPAGSTAYNLSAHGPILPIGANLLALTPVSAFRPRRWRGALLRHDAKVEFEIVDAREWSPRVHPHLSPARRARAVSVMRLGHLLSLQLADGSQWPMRETWRGFVLPRAV